jgi:hypothetical protein
MKDSFNYRIDFRQTDFRLHPECYRVGKGEQGVLLVEPYKSEILPHWRFKNPEIARQSSQAIYEMFLVYLTKKDFVGADMARKFLQMGYTRSRRYANHRSGRKYASNPQKEATPEAEREKRRESLLSLDPDPVKAESAEIFREQWKRAESHPDYQAQMREHREKYEGNGQADEMSNLEFFNRKRQKTAQEKGSDE